MAYSNKSPKTHQEMENKGTHFVLVHGSCHGAWCWYKVVALLKSKGHKVTTLDLASSGIHPKPIHEIKSISDYVEPLMDFMASLPPEERVILVGHSVGGACISVAMERFPEKISVAVFATACMPGPDLSFSIINEKYGQSLDSYLDSEFTFDKGPGHPPTTIVFGPKFMESKLYQLSPPEDLVLGMSLIRPINLSVTIFSPEDQPSKEKYGSVNRVFILCDQDNVMKPSLQEWMIQNNPPDEVKVINGSDHMVMFSKPVDLTCCLQEIAQKYS
ncbi:methyl jasmonate esterase 1-like [Humulus lupulus]|uniref:methyl jasmonate esterase 1-like n=1 Tax=Humulus lupulus TaxID=3486 RepID=UPI002B4084C2|nr:methyl jasmonate esterase 1-like [Humulus lupulus]XP_062102166.1 methyl jasmonate esterase 1-like [Humulus lupulus]XP_062102167.1 methyl jasmonate esterase 1-like [Humulus lupulus]